MVEHRTQFVFKGNREHISKVNIPNITYPNQHHDIETPYGSRDHVIVPDTLKITSDFEIALAEKTRSIVNNVGKTLVKRKMLMLGSNDIDTISNSDFYDTYKDLYLSKKERDKKLLQDMESVKCLKACTGKKADGTALVVTIQEDVIKKKLDKRFEIP